MSATAAGGSALHEWATWLREERPRCLGYANCCVCERCKDRADRYEDLVSSGVEFSSAAVAAKSISDDYHVRPWRYRKDPDSDRPPQPLREESWDSSSTS